MVKEFGYSTRESLKSMKNTDAQKIMSCLGELEFPTFYKMSLQFALFKVRIQFIFFFFCFLFLLSTWFLPNIQCDG